MKRFALLSLLVVCAPVRAEYSGELSDNDGFDAGSTVLAPVPVPVPEAPPVVSAPPVVPPAAPDAPVDAGFIFETAAAIRKAVEAKEWGRLIFLVITVLVIFTRKFLAPRVAFFRGKFGPPLLAFLWAAAGGLATSWPAGQKPSFADVFLALQAGIMAAGGWSLLKAVLEALSPKEPGQTNWASSLLTFFKPALPLEEVKAKP